MPKAKQLKLFDDDYPTGEFVPLHPMFVGRARVLKASYDKDGGTYKVDLSTGECDCDWGQAWVWGNNQDKWIRNKYCIHKLKALADIVARQRDKGNDLTWPYIKAVATRYNKYETTSAFHKELRRGDIERAWFFACILSAYRGLKGVVKYMSNIVYEETRDHDLARFLLDLYLDADSLTVANVCKAVEWFCLTKKKWEMPHRFAIFEAEMKAYSRLIKEYGPGVAKSSGAIPADQLTPLIDVLRSGYRTKDWVKLQIAVKGIQKLVQTKEQDQQYLRRSIIAELSELAGKQFVGNRPGILYDWLMYKAKKHELRYHDVNVFADLVMGEPYVVGRMPALERKRILGRRKVLDFPLGRRLNVPLYAQDNHTWLGKSLIKRYPKQLDPGQKQTDLDFRWCGAYHGLAWRYQAYLQHGTCNVGWHEVKLNKGIHIVTQQMFY